MTKLIDKIRFNGIKESHSKELAGFIEVTNVFSISYLFLDLIFIILFREHPMVVLLITAPLIIVLLNLTLLHFHFHKIARFSFCISAPICVYFIAALVSIEDSSNGFSPKILILGSIGLPFIVFAFKDWIASTLIILIDLFCLLSYDILNAALKLPGLESNLVTPTVRIVSVLTTAFLFLSYILYSKYLIHKSNLALIDKSSDLRELNVDISGKNQELKKINEELGKAIQTKNHFIGVAAHDLRSPIGNIRQWSEILLGELDGELNEEQKRNVEIIYSQSHKMLHLLNDLLDYTSFEEGKLKLNKINGSLKKQIEDIIYAMSIDAKLKQVTINKELDDIADFPFDYSRLSQVINNLLSNAIKFSDRKSEIKISLTRIDDEAVVHIIDGGYGIAPKYLAKIWEAYETGDSTPTGTEKSIGLGLSISKNITDAHGGSIQVQSTLGKGSDFSFSLPMKKTLVNS